MRRDSEEVFAPAKLFARRPWKPGWTAQGVIELLEPLVGARRKERLHAMLDQRLACVTVLMDAPHDPHNGAAVLRSCDAFGVQEVHVVPRHEQFLASNLVAKGAERWVDVVQHRSTQEAADALVGQGFELIATHPEGELTPEDLAFIRRPALVLGNERDGISGELTRLAGRSVRIPMRGFVESLNVSVSAAILLRAATLARPGDLAADHRATLYARGLYYSVRRARDVLAASQPK